MMNLMQGCAGIIQNSAGGLEAAVPKGKVQTLPPGCSWAVKMEPPKIVVQALRELQDKASTKEDANAVRAFRERLYVNDQNIKMICKKGT